jgi:hypothetical protein
MTLLSQAANGKDTFDLTDLFASYKGDPFIDSIHYSPAANQLVAAAIGQRLLDVVTVERPQRADVAAD